jgi:hypothetical protein
LVTSIRFIRNFEPDRGANVDYIRQRSTGF